MSVAFRRSTVALVVLTASLAALAAALIAQYGFDLQPCVLCVYQRWPYVAAAVLAALSLLLPGRWQVGLLTAAALAVLAGAGIAAYHVGVEQHWWAGTAACTGGGTPQTLAELRAQVMAAPVVRCDEVAFSLFGISMAGYNLIYALALALFTFVVMRRSAARGRPA